MQEMLVWSLGKEEPLDEKWQPTPVFLPGNIPWTEEPGGLQSMGSQRVGPDWEHTPWFVECVNECLRIKAGSLMQQRGAASGISWINQVPVNHLHVEKRSNIAWSSDYSREARNVTFVKWNYPHFKVELVSFLRTVIGQTKWHLLAKFGPQAACLVTSDRAQLPLSTPDPSSGPPFREVPPGHLHLDALLDSQSPQIQPWFHPPLLSTRCSWAPHLTPQPVSWISLFSNWLLRPACSWLGGRPLRYSWGEGSSPQACQGLEGS